MKEEFEQVLRDLVLARTHVNEARRRVTGLWTDGKIDRELLNEFNKLHEYIKIVEGLVEIEGRRKGK